MANNANQLTHSPTAENISSPTNKIVPLFIYSPAPERKYMTLSSAPNPSCSFFALRIRLNISGIRPIRCHPTCWYLSKLKQHTAGPVLNSRYIMQPHTLVPQLIPPQPLSLSTFLQRMELPFQTRSVWVVHSITHHRLFLWTPRI